MSKSLAERLADRRTEHLANLEQNLNAVRRAIDFHSAQIENLIPVLRAFDGKVVNKTLNDSIREATAKSGYLERLTHSAYIYTSYNDLGVQGVVDHYRSQSYKVHFQAEDPRRLDADATINDMLEWKEAVASVRGVFEFDPVREGERYDRLVELEKAIENLFENGNIVSTDMLLKKSNYIRYA